jgi:hypothetical protein
MQILKSSACRVRSFLVLACVIAVQSCNLTQSSFAPEEANRLFLVLRPPFNMSAHTGEVAVVKDIGSPIGRRSSHLANERTALQIS